MRNGKVDILKYLPPFLGKDKSFKATNNADSTEHDAIRADLQDLLDQLYVATATWGIEKWEELVDIAGWRGYCRQTGGSPAEAQEAAKCHG